MHSREIEQDLSQPRLCAYHRIDREGQIELIGYVFNYPRRSDGLFFGSEAKYLKNLLDTDCQVEPGARVQEGEMMVSIRASSKVIDKLESSLKEAGFSKDKVVKYRPI